jgi:hypothetical protein
MKESTEKSHRVVNITQTRRVISLDNHKKEEEKQLEPFPYSADPQPYYHRPRSTVRVPTPTKFVPGEFRESDYDSEIDSVRIRPVWTPNPSYNEDPQYRRVRPPSSRSSSVPPSNRLYERVQTPMEFDTAPVMMPSRINIDSPSLKTPQQYFASALYRDQARSKTPSSAAGTTRDDIGIQKSSFTDHASTMNATFKNKAHQFMTDVMNEQQFKQQQQQKPILKKTNSLNDGNSQAYREESRVSQYGE